LSDNKRIWIGVGAGCSVMLLGMCCLMATGLYYCKSTWDDADETAEAFLDDVRGGRIEAAYGRMSEDYRRTHDLDAFQKDLRATPGLLGHQRALIQTRHFEPGRVHLGGVMLTDQGPIEFEITLEQSAGGLGVAGVQVRNTDASE
jgi:hypothetical protein